MTQDAPAKTIVITGASDGVGAAAARQLTERGHRVVVVGPEGKRIERRTTRPRASAAPLAAAGEVVWVGAGALILPGVTIGSRTVIGAGSVVTKDIPEGVLAVGVVPPADLHGLEHQRHRARGAQRWCQLSLAQHLGAARAQVEHRQGHRHTAAAKLARR